MKTLHERLASMAESRFQTDEDRNLLIEAADKIEELAERVKRLETVGDAMAKWLDRNTPVTVRFDWSAAKEAKP
jgi:tetrahydromethanopterin S-methyltransferase subunit B